MASSRAELDRLRSELERLDSRQWTEVREGREVYRRISRGVQQWLPPRDASRLAKLGGVGMAAVGGVLATLKLAPPWHRLVPRRQTRSVQQASRNVSVSTETPERHLAGVTRNFLLGFLLPLWLAAGISDWLCHRRVRIGRNAGRAESAIHLVMFAEAAVPVIAGLFLEITSPILLLMFAAVVAHGATALWDANFAVKRREMPPIEQHVHSYLEMVPVMAASFVAVLHWPEVRAMLGLGSRPADWTIRRKRHPLPTRAVATLVVSTIALEVLPYLEEFWGSGRLTRGRTQPRQLSGVARR